MQVISIYAPIPPSKYRTPAGQNQADSSHSKISILAEKGCELIYHHSSGQAYFSFPEGFETIQNIINVAEDWRIASYLYKTTNIQHTKYRVETVRGVLICQGREVSKTKFETDIKCFENFSLEPVQAEKNLNTIYVSANSRGLHTVYDNNNNVVIVVGK
jgi:hypothetical protein